MPSVPFGPSDQSLNLKNMVYHVVAFFVPIAMFGLRIKTLRLCHVDIYHWVGAKSTRDQFC